MQKRTHITGKPVAIIIIVVLAIIAGITAFYRIDTTGRKGSGLGPEFSYDLDTYREIDPDLIIYEEIKKFSTGLQETHAIAVGRGDNQNIYVAGDSVIVKFSPDGKRLSEIQLENPPRCLTVGEDDTIYVGMKDYIAVYNDKGKRLSQWEHLGPNAYLTSIAVEKNHVFAADAGNRIIHHLNITGSVINRIGAKDPSRNIPGFVIPSPYFDLAVTADGLLRVTNPGKHRIEAYTFKGDLEFFWGRPSLAIEAFCGCCNPVNFALLPDGSFVTCEKGLTRVKTFDAEGNFTGVVAGPGQFIEHEKVCNEKTANRTAVGLDVAVDKQGRILILDSCLRDIRIFIRKKDQDKNKNK